MWRNEGICHALTTEAFTSSCQAYNGAMCSGLPRHHCFFLHMLCRTALLLLSFFCAWLHSRDLLLDVSRLLDDLTLRLSRSCLPMPLGNFYHAGGWHLRRKPCVELLCVSFFPCDILAPRFCTIRVKIISNYFRGFVNYLADSNAVFVVAKIFFKDSNFWCVQSLIICNETAHAHVPWPACTHAIPFRMLRCP